MGDLREFAYRMPRHQRVIQETREGDWYSEEFFARFEPYASSGTWDGRIRSHPPPTESGDVKDASPTEAVVRWASVSVARAGSPARSRPRDG